MAQFGDVLLTLGAVALGIYLLHLLYSLFHRAFQAVGFTPQQASLIILGTFIGGFINIPLAQVNEWVVAVNVGGALVPFLITWQLLRTRRRMIDEALVGVTLTMVVTYLVTDATPQGIVSPFPLWIAPALTAAAVSAVAFWQDRDDAAPLAYVSGTLGALIGADVLRLSQFLAQDPPGDAIGFASIGGAAAFDMVFLTGVLAVGLDLLFFRQIKPEVEPEEGATTLKYGEGLVFTSNTPSNVVAEYQPRKDPRLRARFEDKPAAPRTPEPAESGPTPPRNAMEQARSEWEQLLGRGGHR